jgi:hypothetical protein
MNIVAYATKIASEKAKRFAVRYPGSRPVHTVQNLI